MGKILLPQITTADRMGITPDARELIYDTDLNQVFYGDGTTVGGVPIITSSGDPTLPGQLDDLQIKQRKDYRQILTLKAELIRLANIIAALTQ